MMIRNERLIRLLGALDIFQFRATPSNVGQKTVNLATDQGWITSRRSRTSVRMPDVHRMTAAGAEALERFRTEEEV
jgi:hypothetical protein